MLATSLPGEIFWVHSCECYQRHEIDFSPSLLYSIDPHYLSTGSANLCTKKNYGASAFWCWHPIVIQHCSVLWGSLRAIFLSFSFFLVSRRVEKSKVSNAVGIPQNWVFTFIHRSITVSWYVLLDPWSRPHTFGIFSSPLTIGCFSLLLGILHL